MLRYLDCNDFVHKTFLTVKISGLQLFFSGNLSSLVSAGFNSSWPVSWRSLLDVGFSTLFWSKKETDCKVKWVRMSSKDELLRWSPRAERFHVKAFNPNYGMWLLQVTPNLNHSAVVIEEKLLIVANQSKLLNMIIASTTKPKSYQMLFRNSVKVP